MEKSKLNNNAVITFDSLIAMGCSFSPLDSYRDFCEENGLIDNKTRGFRGVQVLDGNNVISSKQSTYPYPTEDSGGKLAREEIEGVTWTKAFVHDDHVVLVPFLALNHSPMSIRIKKDTPVRLVFWEREETVDNEDDGWQDSRCSLATLHERDRRGG